MKLIYTLPLLASFIVVSGCSDSTNFNFENNIANAAADADPPPLPFPSSFLFAGSLDGTLNIPLDANVDPENFSDPRVALNTLDGFSTTQPLTSSFSAPLDETTLVAGETVRLFEVTTDAATGAVTSIVDEVPAQTYALAVTAETTLVLQTLVPFQESTDYMIVVTDGVRDTAGAPAVNSIFRLTSGTLPLVTVPDIDGDGVPDPQEGALDPTFANLEPVRQLNNVMLQFADAAGIERDSIVQIWSAKTQSITPVFTSLTSSTQASTIALQPVGLSTSDVNANLPGVADIYVGSMDIAYYLTPPANPNDPAGISSFWRGAGGSFLTRFNSVPIATSIQPIPVLMSVPNVNSGQTEPAAGWPVAIFVHGITRNRGDMLAIADSMAAAGYAVIAIDQPMHGITDENNGFRTTIERTFDIDLVNNATGAPGPDGLIDSSGTHFFSPAQLLTTRDNIRQSVADLLVLSASIANIEGVSIDASRKALIGYSLGGTAAATFAAFDDTLSSVTLAKPAAGLVQMVLASPAFNGPLLAGLADAGLIPGTPEFSQFVVSAQTVTDSADPINFGAQAAALHQIHMIEVVGDEAAGIPPDQTVLNTVDGAPFSGSTPLARVMGLPQVSASTIPSGIVRFTAGDHSSFLDPTTSLAATVEMQTQTATFAASGGTLIQILDSSVILSEDQ